jgi:hypothetical protein
MFAEEAMTVGRTALAAASGSRVGKEAKMSGLQMVSLLLPEPFAPPMRKMDGRFTLTWRVPAEAAPSFAPPSAGFQAAYVPQ